jgi:hypothetical protein
MTAMDDGEPKKIILWDEKSENSYFRAIQSGKTFRFENKAYEGQTLNCSGGAQEATNLILWYDNEPSSQFFIEREIKQ